MRCLELRSNLQAISRELAADQRGASAVVTSLALTVLVGFAGLAIDVGYWQANKRNMQGAADQAAFAAANGAQSGFNPSAATNAGNGVTAAFGYVDGQNNVTVSVHNPPTESPCCNGDSYDWEVVLTQTQPMWFTKLFLSSAPVTKVTAVARDTPSTSCVIALDPGNPPNTSGIVGAGSGGINVSGGGTMNLVGCDLFANATNSASINVTGGGTLSAQNIFTDGGTSGTVTATQRLVTYDPKPVTDPYASTRSIPSWSLSGCDNNTTPSGSYSAASKGGVYVWCSSITPNGALVLGAGVYIVNGSFTTGRNVTCTGCTIIVTSTSPSTASNTFTFSSGATLNLTAPTSGSTAGITLWADGRMQHAADNFRAGSTANIRGAVYMPSHMVNFSGSASAGSTCFQMVADEIAISGGANFSHSDCSGVSIIDPTIKAVLIN